MAEIDWNVSEMRKPFTRIEDGLVEIPDPEEKYEAMPLGACNVKRLVGILLAESDMILCEG